LFNNFYEILFMSAKSESPRLPAEIWQLIGSHLSTADLRRLAQTSKQIHQALMNNKEIWMDAFKKEDKYLNSYAFFPLARILKGQKHRMVEPLFLSGGYR
jgi:hypothetical protein